MAAIPSSAAATPAKEAGSTSRYKKALSFRWTISIEEYEMFGTAMTSPCFSVLLRPATPSQPELNSVWHLRWYYGVLSLWQGSWLHTKQEEKSDCHKGTIRSCQFFILNENQEVVHSTDKLADKNFFVNDHKPIKAVEDEKLRLRYKYDNYFFNGKLTIQVEADLFFLADTIQFDSLPSDEVSKGIYSLYKDEVLTDTIIKCQDKEFKVHRVILASQSPVFRAMFEVDMKEKQSGVIEVSDITPEAMSDLVTYLYTGTTPNLKTLASELLEVAEKYQLPHLLTKCENDKMKEASVIGTLILADLHGRVCLKKACLEYIRLNSARVFKTREWADFKDHKNQNAQLYLEVLEYLIRCA